MTPDVAANRNLLSTPLICRTITPSRQFQMGVEAREMLDRIGVDKGNAEFVYFANQRCDSFYL
jgi:hypothetical protein